MRASNEALLKARVPRAGGRPGYPSRSCVRTRRAEERPPPPSFLYCAQRAGLRRSLVTYHASRSSRLYRHIDKRRHAIRSLFVRHPQLEAEEFWLRHGRGDERGFLHVEVQERDF